MSNRRWIVTTVASVLLLVALNLVALAAVDPYGMFRNPAGRGLPLYYADRVGKYLLNTRYIPANFDALLIGPSSSVNWDAQTIAQGTGLRFYNESLEGGNATEQRLLVDRALARGHFRVALLVIYPTMTSTHKMEDGLDKTRWTQGLGSLDVYIQIVLSALVRLHVREIDRGALPDGSHAMHNPHGIDPTLKLDFHEDPVGLRNLETLTGELQSHGIRVICVIPPLFQPIVAGNRDGLESYKSQMMSALPGTTWIDLDGPEYAAMRSDPANYIDDLHVTPRGAEEVSRELHERLLRIVAQAGWEEDRGGG